MIIAATVVAVTLFIGGVTVDAAEITSNGKDQISLSGRVEAEDSSKFMKALGELNIEYVRVHGWELWINTPGGDGSATLSIVYMIDRYKDRTGSTLSTYLPHSAYSAGAIFFLCGDLRFMSKVSDLMLHEAAYYTETGRVSRNSEIGKSLPQNMWDKLDRLNAFLKKLIVAKTTLPYSKVLNEEFLTLEQCLHYKIATHELKTEGGRI